MKSPESILAEQLAYLQLTYFKEHYQTLADQAAREQWPPVQYLSRLVEGEAALRRDRATQRRVQAARFPVIKSLEEFQWTWPKKIVTTQLVSRSSRGGDRQNPPVTPCENNSIQYWTPKTPRRNVGACMKRSSFKDDGLAPMTWLKFAR